MRTIVHVLVTLVLVIGASSPARGQRGDLGSPTINLGVALVTPPLLRNVFSEDSFFACQAVNAGTTPLFIETKIYSESGTEMSLEHSGCGQVVQPGALCAVMSSSGGSAQGYCRIRFVGLKDAVRGSLQVIVGEPKDFFSLRAGPAVEAR